MFSVHSARTAAALALLLLTPRPLEALPPDFDREGRDILVDLRPEEARAPLAAPGADALTFNATLDEEQAAKYYALRVAGRPPTGGWAIIVNGQRLESDAVSAPEGLWYQIPPALLREGVNEFVVQAPAGQPVGVTELEGFSLENSAEEAHFERIFAGPIALVQPPTDPLQDVMDVLHCDLAITLDMSAATIPAATLTLTAQSLTNSLSQCVLDFNDNGGLMVVDQIDSGPSTPALTYTWDTVNERLRIDLPAPVPSGSIFTVRVAYHGTPSTAGAFGAPYRRSTHSGVPIVFTFSEPYGARQWWPCKDVPEDKFTIDLHVTCPDASYSGYPLSVASNGDLVSVVDNGSTKTFNWSESYPLASYLVALLCTNYRAASGIYTALDGVTTMEVAHHVYPESYASESQELPRTIEVMDFFADTFGEFPFLQEKYWTATHSSGSGMEHQTCTSMPNNNLNNPPYHRRNIHELAHSWFGDLITNRHFDHLWIQEGWATYAEALWVEFKEGDAAFHSYVDGWTTSDAYPIVSSSADSFSTQIVYRKGAWVLHMLRHIIGDTAFFQGTRDYLADAALRYGTALTADMQAHFEAAAGQDLDWFFNEWLYQAPRPDYQWSWTWHRDGLDTIIDLTIRQNQATPPYRMPLDFLVNFQGGGSALVTVTNDATPQLLSANAGRGIPATVTLDPDNWVLEYSALVSESLPGAPTLLSVIGDGAAGTATLRWVPPGSPGLLGFRLYESADGMSGWVRIRDEATLTAATTTTVLSGLPPNAVRFYRLTAVDNTALPNEGPPSDVMGVRLGIGPGEVLVVDAYDRWNSQPAFSGGQNHFFPASHGRAVAAHGTPFDSCANEALGAGVALTSYPIVVWSCGDESTVDETLSDSEQGLVRAFLEGGGKMFITGNEIGWDLGRSGVSSPTDLDFYNNWLHATYVADASYSYTTSGEGSPSCFGTHAFAFGTGGDAPYLPGYPDVLAANGADVALRYGSGDVAGIQFEGLFGAGTTPGQLVYLGFAFETVFDEPAREQMMRDVLDWFGASIPAGLVFFGTE